MNNITKSATKLVLLYIVGILGILALVAGVYSIITETFSEAAKVVIGSFTGSVTFLLGYYFGYKGETANPAISSLSPVGERGEDEDTKKPLPFGGK